MIVLRSSAPLIISTLECLLAKKLRDDSASTLTLGG